MKQRIAFPALIALVFTLFLAGCGGSTATTTSQPAQQATPTVQSTPTPTPVPPPDGYLRADKTGVRWLQWTEASGQITGLWNTATLDSGKIVYTNGALSGTQNGHSISLEMKYLGQEVAATGTLQDNVLHLETPGNNGQMETVTYYGVSTAQYTQAMSAFKKTHPA